MRISVFIFAIVFIGPLSLWAQSGSDYYTAPVDTSLFSKYLNEKKEITVILPRAYTATKPTKFPVIVVFDQQNKAEFREIFESINYMVSLDGMPECVIIGVRSDNGNARYLETSFQSTTKKARGEQMLKFVYDELLPWSEANFNTSQNRIFIGHSRFGFFVSCLLQNKLTDLTGVIAASPFFLQDKINLVDSLTDKLREKKLN